nr:Mariner Mos1 transposase [Hymenolepis microstoma]
MYWREWFQRFMSDDFAAERVEKVVEDAELEAIDSYCEGLRKKDIGVLGTPRVETSRDVERRLFACEQLVEMQTRKVFLHRIVTGVDSCQEWVHYNNPNPNPSAENHGDCPHDNARPPHVAKLVVKKYLETLKWDILPHPPPYSPDVAPSHFHPTHLAQWHTDWLTSTIARMKILSKDEHFFSARSA